MGIIAFVLVCSETDEPVYVEEMNYKTAHSVLCSTYHAISEDTSFELLFGAVWALCCADVPCWIYEEIANHE